MKPSVIPIPIDRNSCNYGIDILKLSLIMRRISETLTYTLIILLSSFSQNVQRGGEFADGNFVPVDIGRR